MFAARPVMVVPTYWEVLKSMFSEDPEITISIMGGDAGDTEIYCYALVDGVEAGRVPMKITSYGEWDTQTVHGIEVQSGQVVTVGISVKCAGAGSGAWGKIDDALLNSEN